MSSNIIPIVLIGGILLYALSKGYLDNLFNFGNKGGNTPTPGGSSGGFVAVGDIEKGKDVIDAMAAENPGLVVLLGDYAYSGSASTWWNDIMASIHNITHIATEGNHDDNSYLAVFGQSSWNITHSHGSVLFVGVNTESVDEAFTRTSIESGQMDPAVQTIVVFMHKPMFTPQGAHHGGENQQLHEIFTANPKVKLVLSGHNHDYTRMNERDGITYVTVGTGGRSLRNVSADGDTAVVVNEHGYLSCSISGGSILCNFKNTSGEIMDSFTVAGGATVPAAMAKSNYTQLPGIPLIRLA